MQLITIHDTTNTAPEHQGTKYKFWHNNKLFKSGKVAGENWAEIIAYQLTLLLDLPAAKYEPAEYTTNNKTTIGTLSPNFVDNTKGERLINANELLAGWLGNNYNQTKTYKQKAYTFSRSIALFKLLDKDIKTHNSYSAIQQFIGYLILDTLIANQDRHHENWGFIFSPEKGLYLAPTYDHGASLACRLLPKERSQRLSSNDKQYQVEFFAQKAKTAFYHEGSLLKTYALAKLCLQHYPKESNFWLLKVKRLSDEQLTDVVNCLPNDYMSNLEKEFTLKLLKINQKYLMELQCAKR